MVVGIARLALHFPQSRSLKAKRKGLRSIIDRLRAKFNVAVAEVDTQDNWQRGTVGVAALGNDAVHVRRMLDTIIAFVDGLYIAPLLDRQIELVSFDQLRDFDDTADFGAEDEMYGDLPHDEGT